jgi:hypothetical protein
MIAGVTIFTPVSGAAQYRRQARAAHTRASTLLISSLARERVSSPPPDNIFAVQHRDNRRPTLGPFFTLHFSRPDDSGTKGGPKYRTQKRVPYHAPLLVRRSSKSSSSNTRHQLHLSTSTMTKKALLIAKTKMVNERPAAPVQGTCLPAWNSHALVRREMN